MTTRRVMLIGLAAALGGCGFRPLLKQGGEGDAEVGQQLAAVEVPEIKSRVGYLVRDSLLDQLNPTGAKIPRRYLLTISLKSRTAALGIQLNNTITRYNLTLAARFSLLDSSNRRVLYESIVHRVASYNASNAIYSQLTAEMAAERNAALEVSTDIRTQLAIYFARQAEAEAA
ncbi:MAG TPA: LPS assembly lipoprotein LptE [Geminicoccaceae bacterium]|nr:LPS assembly lipoprotein LptE [Geminicoccaceae bacterium]